MSNPETVIAIENVSKDFDLTPGSQKTLKAKFIRMAKGQKSPAKKTQHALSGIDINIHEGEFFGITGRNGSGKSTLLKLLAGIYQPTKGKVHVKGKLVPFIELGVGFNPELTGRDNVYLNGAILGFSEAEIDEMYDGIVEFSELEKFMDQKLKNYSSGMQVRLAFSVAVRAGADILLIDEVLAVGDADFQRKCFNYFRELKKKKQTVVFVSHDMNAIREYCDRAVLIEKSKVIAIDTPEKIATKYSKMFMDTSGKTAASEESEDPKRWGDGRATFSSISVKSKIAGNKDVEFSMRAHVNEDLESPIFGFLIKNAAGQALMGTNTKILKHVLGNYKKGAKIDVSWTVPNVFSDGEYTIEPAIVDMDGLEVCDWWEEAARFTILKEDRTPYLITPAVSVDISNSKKDA